MARWLPPMAVASFLVRSRLSRRSEVKSEERISDSRVSDSRVSDSRVSGERFWVLRGEGREFYVCATITARGMAALCVFESEEGVRRHLGGLTEFQMFLDTLDHHGAGLPSWVREESLMPRVVEVGRWDLARISRQIGVGHVAVNPPAAGARVEKIKVVPANLFAAKSERGRRKDDIAE